MACGGIGGVELPDEAVQERIGIGWAVGAGVIGKLEGEVMGCFLRGWCFRRTRFRFHGIQKFSECFQRTLEFVDASEVVSGLGRFPDTRGIGKTGGVLVREGGKRLVAVKPLFPFPAGGIDKAGSDEDLVDGAGVHVDLARDATEGFTPVVGVGPDVFDDYVVIHDEAPGSGCA